MTGEPTRKFDSLCCFTKHKKKPKQRTCTNFFLQNVNIIQHSNVEEVADLPHDRDASRVCDDDTDEDGEEEDDDESECEVDCKDNEEE